MTKRYINVAYKDRDMAKKLGARWDPSVKRWYCPPGSALAKVYSWRKGSGSPDSMPEPGLLTAMPVSPYMNSPAQAGQQLSFLG